MNVSRCLMCTTREAQETKSMSDAEATMRAQGEQAELYPTVESLPPAIRADLSPAAQQVYWRAFNSAWKRYADFADREPFCHRIARSSVKRHEGSSNPRGRVTTAAHHIGP